MKKKTTAPEQSSTNYDSESIVDIDKDQLDEEWIKQPKLYLHWALKAADLKDALQVAKAELDHTESVVFQKIQANPEKYGLSKVIKETLVNAVKSNVVYMAAQEKVRTIQKKLGKVDAIVSALSHRKAALEGLVYLHNTGYFAQPHVDGVAKEVADSLLKKRRGESIEKRERH